MHVEYDPYDLFDEGSSRSAEFLQHDAGLHGVWVDQVGGSTIYVDGRGHRPRAVYCYQGDHSLTGVYVRWWWNGHQYVGQFQWLTQPIAGYMVLQKESPGVLVGGWWYDRDVPEGQRARLPFVPGIHPVRWVRQADDRAWPDWAVHALSLREARPITTAALPLVGKQPLARTAEGRYHQRLALWTGARTGLAGWTARLAHHAWWLLHNVVAHPLLALARGRTAVRFHDWTSQRLNREVEAQPPSPLPQVERPLWWWLHNVASHLAIGLAPCAVTFRWHDATAERMRVRGWV